MYLNLSSFLDLKNPAMNLLNFLSSQALLSCLLRSYSRKPCISTVTVQLIFFRREVINVGVLKVMLAKTSAVVVTSMNVPLETSNARRELHASTQS